MSSGFQMPLLPSPGLLNPRVVRQFLDEKQSDTIPGVEARLRALREWVASIPARRQGGTEPSLEQAFNQKIFAEVLGYQFNPTLPASAWLKPPQQLTGIASTPDVVLGEFTADGTRSILAVLELKAPGTPFDLPQARPGRRTPVEQAFDYADSILGVRWVLVSDMRQIRLYSIESRSEYELFDLPTCAGVSGRGSPEFRKFYFLLHREFLIHQGTDSTTSRLLSKSLESQIRIREAFYSTYYQIRSDLLEAVEQAAKESSMTLNRNETLEATQRLLDRMLFLYYCEDHPNRLIDPETIKLVTESARSLPGATGHRVYDSLKALFREVDEGSPRTSGMQIPAYNGELFKRHPVIDEINLPDELHDRQYFANDASGKPRVVNGVWGLHRFDFWQEINEHLLGHIFEESLSDIVELVEGREPDLAEKLTERRRWGIYYTSQILADFLLDSALRDILAEFDANEPPEIDEEERLADRLDRITSLCVIDFACGSGAFLVSAYRELQAEYLRLRAARQELQQAQGLTQIGLEVFAEAVQQAALIRSSLYGVDLLPQAVELAKLALWLRSARKGERVADLHENLVAADSLDLSNTLATIKCAPGSFDLVVGNPPWGGEIDPEIYAAACDALGLSVTPAWDSWELFVALGLHALKEGGRLALVVPDTLFSPEKSRTRRLLLDNTIIEKLHNLGPDWFGKHVRMGTTVIQARKARALITSDFTSVLLTGPLRRQAIRGEVPLRQIEARYSRSVPQERCKSSPTAEIEIFRSRQDDEIIHKIETNSTQLSVVCSRYRGEEMSKAGLLWRCPGCLRTTIPGKKLKGGRYAPKHCPQCGLELNSSNTTPELLVAEVTTLRGDSTVPYIDGDDIATRYQRVIPSKRLRLGVSGWQYKKDQVYDAPKVLIRQAGVGLWATYDESGSRCPQSVYIYRLRSGFLDEGYSHEYLLAALLSRTMAYYVFKRFAEVDPARAHAKVTHTRLERLPIPKVDLSRREHKALHDSVKARVRKLLDKQAALGGREDLEIESALRRLWGLSADDGVTIHRELLSLPDSEALRGLFPPDLRSAHPPPLAVVR